jgi:hypothetical protein
LETHRAIYPLKYEVCNGPGWSELSNILGVRDIQGHKIYECSSGPEYNTLLKMTKGKPMLMCAGENIPPS